MPQKSTGDTAKAVVVASSKVTAKVVAKVMVENSGAMVGTVGLVLPGLEDSRAMAERVLEGWLEVLLRVALLVLV